MPPATISSEEYALDEGRQRLGVDPVLAHNHCQLPHELGPKADASHPASIPVQSENSVRHEAHAQPQRNGTRWKSCWICFSASSTGRKKGQGTILELYPIARYSGLKVRRVCLGFSGALDRLIA